MRLGSDPEVFLQDKAGSPVSVIGYINADKWNPMQIPDMPEGYTLQEDNVALEYGIPPAASADEFVEHIQSVMSKSLEYLPELSFSKLSCIVFPEEQMKHPMAYVFGCEPDFNAWTKEMNPKPQPPHPLMRSAGGHVHVETKVDSILGVRAMDLCLSVPAVLMDNGELRKQLYGKAGAYRPKPYGFEYRTLSNFWVFDDKLIRWVWRNTERAMAIGDVSHEMDRILEAVNNGNKKVAEDLINDYNLEVV
jgi:Phage phiEco32-like COOH.NH2 ligase-type 2